MHAQTPSRASEKEAQRLNSLLQEARKLKAPPAPPVAPMARPLVGKGEEGGKGVHGRVMHDMHPCMQADSAPGAASFVFLLCHMLLLLLLRQWLCASSDAHHMRANMCPVCHDGWMRPVYDAYGFDHGLKSVARKGYFKRIITTTCIAMPNESTACRPCLNHTELRRRVQTPQDRFGPLGGDSYE